MDDALRNLPDWALLEISQIASQQETERQKARIGLLPVGRTQIWTWMKEGRIPKGRKIKPEVPNSALVWTAKEIREVADRIARGEL